MLRVGHLTEFISRRNSDFHKERKRTKKKEKLGRRGLWKLPQLWKSIKVAFGDFFLMISTSCLKKPTQERLRLFHSYAQARRRLIYQPIFKRQRSTLSMLFFGPKNGEHLRPQLVDSWSPGPGR